MSALKVYLGGRGAGLGHLWLCFQPFGYYVDVSLLKQHEFFLANTMLCSAEGSGELELLTKSMYPLI